jgi:hypothetical protein
MCAATFACDANPDIELNVSFAVFTRCAVQITVNPGQSRHNAKQIAPNRYVLPTCRGIDTKI